MSGASEARPLAPVPMTRIQPSRGWSWAEVGDLWRYRELIYFLVWRDVKVRYKQTLLGAGWAILKPFLSMVIFTLVFAGLAGLETDGAPPPVFYYAGLLPWVLFQDGVSKAGNSLVTGSHLITKVYFPRLAIPLASVAGGVVDFGLALLVLFGLMAFYGVSWTPGLAAIPAFLVLALITATGAGLWLSALNVSYRDVGYVTPFLLQAWLYASPVAYSSALVPEGTGRLVYALNPMAGVVQGFRWAVLGTGQPSLEPMLISCGVALALLVSGGLYFRRMERTFADVV